MKLQKLEREYFPLIYPGGHHYLKLKQRLQILQFKEVFFFFTLEEVRATPGGGAQGSFLAVFSDYSW